MTPSSPNSEALALPDPAYPEGSDCTIKGEALADFYTADQMRAAIEADRSARAVPDGWREALQFYADKCHFTVSEESAWDTVSGEPANFWCDEEGTATVEDGTVAAMALAGTPLRDEEEDAAAPVTSQAEPHVDSTSELHVGDSSFESWMGCHEPDRRDGRHPAFTKQDMRDAYAAGMGDPLVVARTSQAESVPSVEVASESVIPSASKLMMLDKLAAGRGFRNATEALASLPRASGLKATLQHDAGAYAQCFYCKRYSLDPKTLGDRAPTCDCGKDFGWSGSFKPPGADAKWSGTTPQAQAAPAPANGTVPWPEVAAYAGGLASGGVAAWLKVRFGDGPETTEFIRSDLAPVPATSLPTNGDAYAAGWTQAAKWADRVDLIADIGSAAYKRDRATSLLASEPASQLLQLALSLLDTVTDLNRRNDSDRYTAEKELIRVIHRLATSPAAPEPALPDASIAEAFLHAAPEPLLVGVVAMDDELQDSGGTSQRAKQRPATPKGVADQVVASMEFMTHQDAYDLWISVNPGAGREFLKLVRSQLITRGISVEA